MSTPCEVLEWLEFPLYNLEMDPLMIFLNLGHVVKLISPLNVGDTIERLTNSLILDIYDLLELGSC